MGGVPGRRPWRLARRRGLRDGPRLVPIGQALGGTLAVALVLAAAVTIAGLHVLHFHRIRPEPQLTAGSLYSLLKVAFAFAAGVGGVFALVTAYRRQRVAEFAQDLADRAEDREAARLFDERFATAAGQLGHDNAAVRLAGVYAMARLADDWPAQRQTCVDVLCAYLRMPYQPDPDPGPDVPLAGRQAFRSLREVRHTVIRVITAHLQPDYRRAPTAQDWRGLSLDFTGTAFDGGDFAGAEFTGEVSFTGAQFTGGQFADGTISFDGAVFTGGQFTGGTVSFTRARFNGGEVSFTGAQFTDGRISFDDAEFASSSVNFYGARFTGGTVGFTDARFTGGTVSFTDARFAGSDVSFIRARFAGGTVSFTSAQFAEGAVSFYGARFTGCTVDFEYTQFTGSTVSFEGVEDWSLPPLGIDWPDPPPGVLPRAGPPRSDMNASPP
jgi:uncharacterized protein YjbI with pentapeptide repeats